MLFHSPLITKRGKAKIIEDGVPCVNLTLTFNLNMLKKSSFITFTNDNTASRIKAIV